MQIGVKDVNIKPIDCNMCQVDLINIMGERRARIFNMNPFTFKVCYNQWKYEGKLIQDAFPMFSPIEREFLVTGVLQEDWDDIFPSDEE